MRTLLRRAALFSKHQDSKIMDPTDYYNNRKQSLNTSNNYPYNFRTTRSV